MYNAELSLATIGNWNVHRDARVNIDCIADQGLGPESFEFRYFEELFSNHLHVYCFTVQLFLNGCIQPH